MKRFCLLIASAAVISLISPAACTQEPDPPQWFMNEFKKTTGDKFDLISTFKPRFLQADFNGDREVDIAAPVKEKASGKLGILVIHGKTMERFLFGAGKNFATGSDDFQWIDEWSLYSKKTAEETVFDKKTGDIQGSRNIKLNYPGILIMDVEDGAALAGGILYFNGKKYIWIHQGE